MALQTGGFALSQFARTPQIPTNVGKLDVNGIYDSVVKGLQTSDALRTTLARQRAEDANFETARQQSLAQQQVLPSQTEATIATNTRTGALASPEIVQREAGKTLAGLDADLVAEQNRRNDLKFQSALSPEQRFVLAQKGPQTATTDTVVRNPDNSVTSKESTNFNVGGTAVPGSTKESTSPGPLLIPLQGPNGTTFGTVISSVGPDGKPSISHISTPGSLLNQNAGTTYQLIGTKIDEQGNKKFMVQAMTQTLAGGAPKPVGSPRELATIRGLPGIDPEVSNEQGQAFISKDASKAIEDAQGALQGLQTRKLELQNITNAADAFTKDTTGRFAGPIRASLGDAKAQEFVGSVQNALSTALQPLRGTGRVSQTEFNQALSALPKVDDQAETIRNKLNYLNLVTDWGLAREQSYLDNLGKGQNRYTAFQNAQKDTPIPEIPNFYTGATTPSTVAGIGAPVGAPTPAPSKQVGGFKIIEVK